MKKNNKRTKKGAIIALCMAGAIAISGAFAFLSDSESAINRFSFTDKDGEQTVDVEIQEPNWHEENGKDILPLETVTKDPQVVNMGENDVYSFVTVLVPTAKNIKLNANDGTVYPAKDVELFTYSVKEGWTEVGATADKVTVDEAHSFTSKVTGSEAVVTGAPVLLKTNTVDEKIVPQAITNRAETTDANIYYTAHTYAYAKDGAMTRVASGDTTETLFDTITMINIADGDRLNVLDKMNDEQIDEYMVKFAQTITSDDGDVSYDSNKNEITVTGETGFVVAYKVVKDNDGINWLVDKNGNKQYKAMSQFEAEDNINVYVNTYAIQADNTATDIDACWALCANTNAGIAEGTALTNDFYFSILANDIGAKSAVKDA